MDAVYGIDKVDQKTKARDRILSASQVNMCYEAPNNDYVITSSATSDDVTPRRVSSKCVKKSPERIVSQTRVNFCYEGQNEDDHIIVSRSRSDTEVPQKPNQLDFLRKEDDMVTSFQISQGGLVTSRPSFTAIRPDSVKTDAQEYTTIDTPYSTPTEPIYAEPENEYHYDASNVNRLVDDNSAKRTYSNDYASFRKIVHEYKPVDDLSKHGRKYTNIDDVIHRNVPEYVKTEASKGKRKLDKKKDRGKKNEEESVYENDDTMMVY